MAKPKIALIGGGNIGGVLAEQAAYRELGDVIIFDVVEGMPQGKALDMAEGAPLVGSDARSPARTTTRDRRRGRRDHYGRARAQAGHEPRRPAQDEPAIMKQVAEGVRDNAPDAFVIVISNPLDAMVYTFKEVSGFPKNRVVGMAGVLDSTRFRSFVAWELGVSVQDVTALVLGGHGDTMVPLVRYCTVAGIPIEQLIPRGRSTRSSSAPRVPAARSSACSRPGRPSCRPRSRRSRWRRAILKDKKRVLACACLCEGEYGVDGLYVGVPCVIGAGGVERIIEVELDADEQKHFDASVEHVRTLVDQIEL